MKKLILVAGAAGLLSLAACGDNDEPTPVTNVTIIENGTAVPDRGGPCGDGTVLAEGQKCP